MIGPEISRQARAHAQRGQVVILMVLLLVLGSGFLVYSMAGPRGMSTRKNTETDAALAMAKQAILGWSAARTPDAGDPTYRPGELPCPDTGNDGSAQLNCVAGAIGRVPWKTLGIPEPRDGSGEILWYAISGPFRYKPQASQPITSDTLGNLTVYQGSSAITLTSQAIAVLFAPGAPLGTQARGTTLALCSTTGTTIQQNNCAANYLESTGGVNNAQTGGPFVQSTCLALNTGPSSCLQTAGSFNDRLLPITNADLMPLVEQRVAHDMLSLLDQYYDANGIYPWADQSDGNSNVPPDGYNRGRFPCGTASPDNWGDPGTPTLPDWLTNGCGDNGWASVIFYAVAKNKLQAGGSGCSSDDSMCSASKPFWTNSGFAYLCPLVLPFGSSPFACSLTNVGSGNADVILITPGASDGSPRNWPNGPGDTPAAITGYFEDAENRNNNDDRYAIPSPSNDPNRDRMFIMR